MTEKQKCEAMIYRPGPGGWPGHDDHCQRPAKYDIRVARVERWGDDKPSEPFTMHVCGVHYRTITKHLFSTLSVGTGELSKLGWRMEEATVTVGLVQEGKGDGTPTER